MQPFVFVSVHASLGEAVCSIMTHTVLGQPRERKPITTVREREGQRIPQYPTEHWVVIDLFSSAVSLSSQPLCA